MPLQPTQTSYSCMTLACTKLSRGTPNDKNLHALFPTIRNTTQRAHERLSSEHHSVRSSEI
jgi:hypothetical protein